MTCRKFARSDASLNRALRHMTVQRTRR